MEMHSLYHCSYVLSEFFDLTTTKTLTWECEKRYRSMFPVFFSVKQNMVDVCITQQIAWQLNSMFIRHCYLLACFITGYLLEFTWLREFTYIFPITENKQQIYWLNKEKLGKCAFSRNLTWTMLEFELYLNCQSNLFFSYKIMSKNVITTENQLRRISSRATKTAVRKNDAQYELLTTWEK